MRSEYLSYLSHSRRSVFPRIDVAGHAGARCSFGHHTIDPTGVFVAPGVENHDVKFSYLHGEEIT
jgi:hypothetical protein